MLKKIKNLRPGFFWLLFIPAAGAFCPAFAAVSPRMETQVSLSGAISIALRNNDEIKVFKNSLAAREEDIGIARSYLLPSAAFGETLLDTNNPVNVFMEKLNEEKFSAADFNVDRLNDPGTRNDFQTSFSVSVPVFARAADIGLAMAKKEFSARKEEYTREKETIIHNVVTACLTVYTAKESLGVAGKNLKDAAEHLRTAEARYKAGLGLYSDVLRASTAVTGAREDLIQAKTNVSVAKKALGLLLGSREPVDITGRYPEISLKNAAYYLNEALARKDIDAVQLRYENAENNVGFEAAKYLPTVGITGSWQLNNHSSPFGAEGHSWTAIVGLQWEWFNGNRRRHEIEKAKYEVNALADYLNGLKKKAEYEVYKSWLEAGDASEAVELAKSALKTAAEGERLVAVRYANGIAPIVDLMDTQLNLDKARANLVVKNNAYRLAVAGLSYQSGTILQDFYKQGR